MDFKCKVCGYIYYQAEGDVATEVIPGTPFEDIPEDWECPICGAGKDEFEELN
jgi:rubredoxin